MPLLVGVELTADSLNCSHWKYSAAIELAVVGSEQSVVSCVIEIVTFVSVVTVVVVLVCLVDD